MPAPAPSDSNTPARLVCPRCAKVLDLEPNFCPACGTDLRGLGGSSDTFDGTRGDTIDGRYRVIEKLGEGGMGAVYKVEHVRMGKVAALKRLRPDHAVDKALKARFLQEARVVAKLSHPNTVQVFDSGELDDGSLFIVMEYVPGKDLAWHLKAHGPMSEGRATAIGAQLLASLQEAHDAGIVHRDIKPANVMLLRRKKEKQEHVKLLDFGIAKLQEAEGRKSTTGDFVGTPAYMSPEQIRGEGVDGRSDLYSLGAVLFELVTGRQLFVGPTPISILSQHTEAPVPRIADANATALVSPAFEAVLTRALEKDKARRFADADAMRLALEALEHPEVGHSVAYTPVPAELAGQMLSREDYDSFERQLRLKRALAPLVVLLLLLAVGGVAWRFVSAQLASTPVTREVEPNDVPSTATRIALGTDVQGTIGASDSASGDRDLYVTTVSAGPMRVTLSGVADLNLTLELLQPETTEQGDRLRRRLFLDEAGLGEPERIDGFTAVAGELYLRVEERPFCTEANRPPRERGLVPYTLRVEPMQEPGPLESEPNDTPGAAQALPMTKAVTAFLGQRMEDIERSQVSRPDAPFSSYDYFLIDAAEGQSMLLVVVPPERGALLLAVLDEAEARKPRVTEVRGAPHFVDLKLGVKGRKVRISPGRDSLAGDTYALAVGSTEDNGVSGVLDLAERLRLSGREETRRLVLEQAAQHLASSKEVGRLTDAARQATTELR